MLVVVFIALSPVYHLQANSKRERCPPCHLRFHALGGCAGCICTCLRGNFECWRSWKWGNSVAMFASGASRFFSALGVPPLSVLNLPCLPLVPYLQPWTPAPGWPVFWSRNCLTGEIKKPLYRNLFCFASSNHFDLPVFSWSGWCIVACMESHLAALRCNQSIASCFCPSYFCGLS